MQLTIKNTIFFSLIVQIITGIISLDGLFIRLPKKHQILGSLLNGPKAAFGRPRKSIQFAPAFTRDRL